MSTGNELQAAAVDPLTEMQSKAIERFELELSDLRTTMMTMATCCEQSLARLRDARWISFDAASRLVTDLSEAAEAERSRASNLSGDLDAAKRELDEVRAECRTEMGPPSTSSTMCAPTVKWRSRSPERPLSISVTRPRLIPATERRSRARGLGEGCRGQVREELNAMQARNQEIVDAQTLRLVELKPSSNEQPPKRIAHAPPPSWQIAKRLRSSR